MPHAQDHDLVFCTRNGKPLAAGNVRRAFRSITKAAGIGGAEPVASGIRCKSAGVVPGFMVRLGDGTDSVAAVGGLAGGDGT